MTIKEASEVQHEMYRIADELSKGNWIPFAMVTLLLGIVVVLLMHIYNTRLKGIDRRNKEHEHKQDKHDALLDKIIENNFRLDKMIALHDQDLSHLKEKSK